MPEPAEKTFASTPLRLPEGSRLILGSASPRRKELLEGLGIGFEVDTRNNFKERFSPDTPADEVPLRLAEGKSEGFHRPLAPGEILLTADTVVILPGEHADARAEILGKPRDRADALRMLHALSGRSHRVVTGVVLRSASRRESATDTTQVHFRALSEEEIAYYVDTCRPYDKAGAYGIQEWIGHAAIDRIDGSYFNVMGLPVHLVYALLGRFAR